MFEIQVYTRACISSPSNDGVVYLCKYVIIGLLVSQYYGFHVSIEKQKVTIRVRTRARLTLSTFPTNALLFQAGVAQ